MPAAYAHYVFGQKVLKELSGELKQNIKDYLPLYHIGIHGPDIFFYYKLLKKNPIRDLGYQMHEEEAYGFFDHAREVIGEVEGTGKDAMKAYIAGFICHFMLDSECHPFISDYEKEMEVSHSQIETALDVKLMKSKGLDPAKRNPAEHLTINESMAELIAPFFDLSAKEIRHAVLSMKKRNKDLLASTNLKRAMLDAAFRLGGDYDFMHGLVVPKEPIEKCFESNMILYGRLIAAAEPCADLIEEYMRLLDTNEPLNERFRRNFE